MSWKGGVKSGKGYGKSKGKGSGKGASVKEDMEKLKNIDPSLKVWIGGLSPDVNWKTLQQAFNQVGRSIYAATFPRSNTGCVAFKTADEVHTAVTTLNGSWIGDQQIEVDYFTKPTGRTMKGGKGKGSKGGKGKDGNGKGTYQWSQPVWKPAFQKIKLWGQSSKGTGKGKDGKGKGKGKGKNEAKMLKGIDNSLKVWIGNLDGSVTWKMLQDHFENNIGKVTWASVFPKGTGCVAFKSADEAGLALALNGSQVGSCTLLVDVFESQRSN